MKKIAIIASLICSVVVAQDFNRHEYSVNIGGGVSSFQTRPTLGKNFCNWSGTVGFGYQFFFHPQWGINSGLNVATCKGGISINEYARQQTAINTATGSAFDFFAFSLDYKESQQITMFTIPLMAQFQHTSIGNAVIYSALGGKAGIPVSAKSIRNGHFTTKGYHPNLNVTYEDLPDYGFVTNQPFPGNKTDIRLKTALMASVESGAKWLIRETISVYVGVYVDYGLNNALKKKSTDIENLVVYQSGKPAHFDFNTAANLYAGKIAPFAGGVILRIAFGNPTSFTYL